MGSSAAARAQRAGGRSRAGRPWPASRRTGRTFAKPSAAVPEKGGNPLPKRGCQDRHRDSNGGAWAVRERNLAAHSGTADRSRPLQTARFRCPLSPDFHRARSPKAYSCHEVTSATVRRLLEHRVVVGAKRPPGIRTRDPSPDRRLTPTRLGCSGRRARRDNQLVADSARMLCVRVLAAQTGAPLIGAKRQCLGRSLTRTWVSA
jgi:hypothetical protein